VEEDIEAVRVMIGNHDLIARKSEMLGVWYAFSRKRFGTYIKIFVVGKDYTLCEYGAGIDQHHLLGNK
jgi:hypothetical protein